MIPGRKIEPTRMIPERKFKQTRMIPGRKFRVLRGANPSRLEAGFSWNLIGVQYYGQDDTSQEFGGSVAGICQTESNQLSKARLFRKNNKLSYL